MTHDPMCPNPNDPDPKCHACHLIDLARDDERAAALRDAVEAVKAVASNMANWSSPETADATKAFSDLTSDQWMWAQRGVHRAIAAIEALGGER